MQRLRLRLRSAGVAMALTPGVGRELALLELLEAHGAQLERTRHDFEGRVQALIADGRQTAAGTAAGPADEDPVGAGAAVLRQHAAGALEATLEKGALQAKVRRPLQEAGALLHGHLGELAQAYDMLRLAREHSKVNEKLNEKVKHTALLVRELIVIRKFSTVDRQEASMSLEELKRHMEDIFRRPVDPTLLSELSLSYSNVVEIGKRRPEYEQSKTKPALPINVFGCCDEKANGFYRFVGSENGRSKYRNEPNDHGVVILWDSYWVMRSTSTSTWAGDLDYIICQCHVGDTEQFPPSGIWHLRTGRSVCTVRMVEKYNDVEKIIFGGTGLPSSTDSDALFAVYELCRENAPYTSKQKASGKQRNKGARRSLSRQRRSPSPEGYSTSPARRAYEMPRQARQERSSVRAPQSGRPMKVELL